MQQKEPGRWIRGNRRLLVQRISPGRRRHRCVLSGMMPTTLLAVEDSKPYKIVLMLGTDVDRSICDVLVDNVFWGSLDTYAATPGQLEVTIPLARLGQHTLEIRNRPERNKAAVPVSATSFKLEFVQMETLYDGQTLQYSYDDLSRLLAADYFAAWDAVNPVRDYTFGYDVAGNRTSEVVNVDGSPFSSQTHTYDAANRISSAGFAYNDADQMTADGTLSYSWDRAGRLLGTGDSSYAYNGLGQRVQQTVSGVVTEYLLDVQPGLAKVIAATTGANTTRFVHERGLLSQQDSNGDWQWMVADGLGSVRVQADGDFDAVASRHFAPYGVSYDEQGVFSVPFAFTGEMLDANDLQYHRARYYNPALGVFPSLDLLEGMLEEAVSLNRYAYVAGNVVNLVDPSGLYGESPGVFDGCWQDDNTACVCGPDVTQWFKRELFLHHQWVRGETPHVQGSGIQRLIGIITIPTDFLFGAPSFALYAERIPYKWIDFNDQDINGECPGPSPIQPPRYPWQRPCGGSVTLCGCCLERSELGNFMYGFAASVWGYPEGIVDRAGQAIGFRPTGVRSARSWDRAAWQRGFHFGEAASRDITVTYVSGSGTMLTTPNVCNWIACSAMRDPRNRNCQPCSFPLRSNFGHTDPGRDNQWTGTRTDPTPRTGNVSTDSCSD